MFITREISLEGSCITQAPVQSLLLMIVADDSCLLMLSECPDAIRLPSFRFYYSRLQTYVVVAASICSSAIRGSTATFSLAATT